MEYLSLMHSIIRSTDYLEHQHRLSDLQGALQRILREEEDPGEEEGSATVKQMDKLIIQQIYKEFPQLSENWGEAYQYSTRAQSSLLCCREAQ